jgi:pyridoxal phosphate enzyme (YggS family)
VSTFGAIRDRIDAARPPGGPPVRLLAVSKGQPIERIIALAAEGQTHFGENYVQEAIPKIVALADRGLAWHLTGPLQSNKCGEVARNFDWIETLDREKLVSPLATARPAGRPPLQVLVQVKLDDEASKSGAAPVDVPRLCRIVAAEPRLRLRGLMTIPRPDPDPGVRRRRFAELRALFESLRLDFPSMDTLSMGMSEDFELAIAEGATEVRIGTALFGPRTPRSATPPTIE